MSTANERPANGQMSRKQEQTRIARCARRYKNIGQIGQKSECFGTVIIPRWPEHISDLLDASVPMFEKCWHCSRIDECHKANLTLAGKILDAKDSISERVQLWIFEHFEPRTLR